MKHIFYELRKLAGIRYIWIFAAALLAANIAIAVYTANQKAERQIPASIAQNFFNEYIAEPERIEREYAELTALINERNNLLIEAMSRRDFDYEPEPLPNKYTDSDRFDDSMLFNEIFSRKDYVLGYASTIQRVIDRAYANIAEFDLMGVSSESYVYQYQLKVIDLYKNAQSNVRIGFEYTRGWDDYFSYDIVNIFIFAILIMFGSDFTIPRHVCRPSFSACHSA
jgi:hypothetical protein